MHYLWENSMHAARKRSIDDVSQTRAFPCDCSVGSMKQSPRSHSAVRCADKLREPGGS
jgi:hypothetical protein